MSSISDDLRRVIYEDYPPPERLFAVITWGCAATDWLASTLNGCPGMFCLHAANYLWTKFAGAATLSGADYLTVVGMQGHAALAAGDVHGVARTDLPEIDRRFGDRFRAAVIVRDPWPRLRSQLALFERYRDFQAWDVDYVERLFPQVVRKLPTGGYDERLFVHGVNMLNAIVDETKVAPVVRMEDVTTQPQALGLLIEHLTAATIKPTEAWLRDAIGLPRTNPHAKGRPPFVLATWQRRVLWDVLLPESIELYRKLGYQLDELLG